MSIGKYVPIVATIIVAVVVMTGVAFPMIGGLSSETTTVSNEGASWIRMGYITDQSDYSAQYTFGDNISVAGQSGDWEDMILYADSQCTVCIVGDYLVKIVGDNVAVSDDPQTVTVSRSNGIVSIDGEPVSESAVSWAYVPVANGKYSSFGADTVPLHRNSELAAVGGFAGVYAYNDAVSQDYGLIMDANVTEEYINSVRWALESSIPVEETQPFQPIDPGMFDPGSFTPIDIDPIDPFDPNENQLMSVPTPTYTDGNWGYEYETVSGVQKAKIVAYLGVGGGAITIPATVGGYDVYSVGPGNLSETVFDTSISATDLIISNGIEKINRYAFKGCSGFTGTLTLPNTLTEIERDAFNGCSGFTGTLTLPTGMTAIGQNAFYNCTHFSGQLVLPSSLTTMGIRAFYQCSGFTGDLTIPNGVTLIDTAFSGCTGITGLHLGNVTTIGVEAFYGCTGLTGTLEIPSSVQTISRGAFYGCTGLTGLILNEGLVSLPNATGTAYGAFYGCTGLTGTLVIPSTVTTIGAGIFVGTGFTNLVVLSDAIPASGPGNTEVFSNTAITQVLNLSNNEWTTTSYGLNAEEVRTDIEATSYMAPVSISETTTREGPTFDLLAILPIIFVAGLLLTTAWMFIRK